MISLRMCMVCRQLKTKDELIRAVKVKGQSVLIDTTYKVQGRGAYVCKTVECTYFAQKKRIFERAFSQKIESEIYEQIKEIAKTQKIIQG